MAHIHSRAVDIDGAEKRQFEGVYDNAGDFESLADGRHFGGPLMIRRFTAVNTRIANSVWKPVDIHSCRFERVTFSETRLYETDFWSCDIEDLTLGSCALSELGFRNCRIRNLVVDDCETDGLFFRNCSIQNLQVARTDLFSDRDTWSTRAFECALLDTITKRSLSSMGWSAE